MEEIRQYYKFRPDEIFRRITVTSLVTLMVEVSKLEYQEEDAQRLDNQIREDQESLQKAEVEQKIESDGAALEKVENDNGEDDAKDEGKVLNEDHGFCKVIPILIGSFKIVIFLFFSRNSWKSKSRRRQWDPWWLRSWQSW